MFGSKFGTIVYKWYIDKYKGLCWLIDSKIIKENLEREREREEFVRKEKKGKKKENQATTSPIKCLR